MNSLALLSLSEVKSHLLAGRPIIDVRAPIEFESGSLPGSTNLPIMNNEERAEVGTVYKQQGQEKAILRGHALVSGAVKAERLAAWSQFIADHPQTIVTCFRGGLRSKITQAWLAEAGVQVPRIEGGYKKIRQLLMQVTTDFSVSSESRMLVVSGATGSGKTLLLRSLLGHLSVCDLEKFANHRGSAFGGYKAGQPSQINFENQLGLCLLGFQGLDSKSPVLVEDESRLIGRNVQPPQFFELLRRSPLVLIEEGLPERVQVTYEDYILNSSMATGTNSEALEVFSTYKKSLERITKKLGGLRTQEVMGDLERAEKEFIDHRGLEINKVWIEKLLAWYYDPMYLGSLNARSPEIRFRGTRADCREYLLSQLSSISA